MRPRPLLLGTGSWALAYAATYVLIIKNHSDSGPAWWYLVLILLGAGLCLAAAAGRRRATSVAALVLLSVAARLGILSVGLLLLPALAGIAVSLGLPDGRVAER